MHERRRHINGILWILKTGAPWRDLPERYGEWGTVHARYRLWQLDGTWDLILEKLLIRFEADGTIDWSLFSVDDGLRKRGVNPVIAHKSNEKGATRLFDSVACKKRNTIERLVGHLKECRRVATRYEKLAVRYHAFVKIACIRYLLTKL